MNEGRFAYDEIDELFHTLSRLRIAAALRVHPRGLTFLELKKLCSLTDGNLSRHLRKLEEHGVVRIAKEFADRMPRTTVYMTTSGAERFAAYLDSIETVIHDVESEAPGFGRLPESPTEA